MRDDPQHQRNKTQSGSPNRKGDAPKHQGGDHIRKAQQWGGGNKAGKGAVKSADKRNPNSSAKG